MKQSSVGVVGCAAMATVVLSGMIPSISTAQEGIVAQPNPIFVTSVTGTGDLATWPDSGMVSGLAGADLICKARAGAAGLADASLYIAWLSDSTDDAYCRAHGMTGTKASNCGGLPDPPSFAGPWARMDGHPFAPKIYLLLGLHGEMYIPVLLDEYGARAPSDWVFTATDLNGEYDGGASAGCANWTSGIASMVPGGSTLRTTMSWTKNGQVGCQNAYPLICMLPNEGPPLMPLFNQGALAFLTNSMGSGRLEDWPEAGGHQGLAAADNICLLRATALGLPHPEEFKAWLSTSTVNAADRFTFGGPWVRPDGVIVAQTRNDLLSGELHAPISQSASGEYWGNHGVWTGSSAAGIGSGFTCNDWAADDGGTTGSTGAVNSINEWSEFIEPTACSGFASLYCLSNVPSAIRIFLDGFENGDPGGWSTTVP